MPQHDVIIIGAGMAGVGAARALADAGRDVIVLEARDRLGGRVWSQPWGAATLDFGANWIHGTEGNPLTELAQRFGVQLVPTDAERFVLYDAQGRRVADRRIAAGEAALSEWLGTLAEQGPDVSLAEAIQRSLPEAGLSAQAQADLPVWLRFLVQDEYAADPADLASNFAHLDDDFDGPDATLPQGYGQLVRGLAQGLEVSLGQVVRAIDYSGAQVLVSTQSDTWQAQRAIVTLPLGVLKAGTVRFTPELPARKQQAIQRLGFGLLNKLVLRFPSVFWDRQADAIGVLSADPALAAYGFINVHRYTGEPILAWYVGAQYARDLEALPDAEVAASALRALRTVYGAGIPQPEAWHYTRWSQDPFALGAYSYLAVGATGADRDALAEPLAGRLYFAGEATWKPHSATVHGALLSGQRAAQAILGAP